MPLLWIYAHRGICELIALVVLFVGFSLYLHHAGAVAGAVDCERRDNAATAAQLDRNSVTAAAAARIINQEVSTANENLQRPIVGVPVVELCRPTLPAGALPAPAGARSGRNATADLRGSNSGNTEKSLGKRPADDVGVPLAAIGRACDVRIAELQDYVLRVCAP